MIDGLNPQIPLHYNERNCRWEVKYSLTHPASIWDKVYRWCWETFGPPGTNPTTGADSGWDYHGGWIHFYDEKCSVMYELRWS
jgi:hypothetical protein